MNSNYSINSLEEQDVWVEIDETDLRKKSCDPLENVGDEPVEPKIYRMNFAVFTEPLTVNKGATSMEEPHIFETEDTVVIDNVSVTKKKGKRRKYSMNIDQSDLTCPQRNCYKVFLSTTLLKAHIRKVHFSEKRFVCEKCGAGFAAQYLLRRHYSVHSNDKIECPVCKKMLSRRTNLQVHLQSHADTRPHECPTCHKRFLRRSTLNVHLSFVHK